MWAAWRWRLQRRDCREEATDTYADDGFGDSSAWMGGGDGDSAVLRVNRTNRAASRVDDEELSVRRGVCGGARDHCYSGGGSRRDARPCGNGLERDRGGVFSPIVPDFVEAPCGEQPASEGARGKPLYELAAMNDAAGGAAAVCEFSGAAA